MVHKIKTIFDFTLDISSLIGYYNQAVGEFD